MRLIANSERAVESACARIREAFAEPPHYLRISISTGRDRSLESNALLHKWFGEIAEQRGENTPAEVKVICKRKFFIPILRAEDEQFNSMISELTGMTEEMKMKLIELLPVTSVCSSKQMARGMDDMFLHYSEMGVELTIPDE